MDALTKYFDMLKAAVDSVRDPAGKLHNTLEVRQELLAVASQCRAEFLSMHPEYVALGQIFVEDGDNGGVVLNAFVCTHEEKAYREHEAQLYRQSLREIFIAEQAKSQAPPVDTELATRLGKLVAKHIRKIPLATAMIWNTLTPGQQYAILKDIDYAERHGGH